MVIYEGITIMGFVEAIKSGYSKYATFSGRASRSEFWYFTLLGFLVGFVAGFVSALFPVLQGVCVTCFKACGHWVLLFRGWRFRLEECTTLENRVVCR